MVVEDGIHRDLTVLDLNPIASNEPEFNLILEFRNQQALDGDDLPQVVFYDFKSDGSKGGIKLVESSRAGARTALKWFQTSSNFIHFEAGASNFLSFQINIPDNQSATSYTAAIVLENNARQPIVII